MKKYLPNHGNTYFRLLMSLALFTVLIVGLASGICYSLFNKTFTAEMIASVKRTMHYEGENFKANIVERSQTLMLDITLNSSYAQPLSTLMLPQTNNSISIFRAYSALETLNNIYNSMIASIVVYYPQSGFLLSSNMGYKLLSDPNNAPYREFVDSLAYKPGTPMSWSRLKPGLSLPGIPDNCIMLTGAAQWQNVTPAAGAVVVIALRPEYIAAALQRMATGGGTVYLTSVDGDIIYTGGIFHDCTPAWELDWGAALLGNEFTSMVAPVEAGGNLYISYPLSGPGWFLILSAPTDAYARASAQVGNITLLVVAGGLAIGLLLTFLLSRRLYSPLKRLMDVVNELPINRSARPGDEYAAISTTIDILSTRLSRAERLERANQPVIRNMIIHDLLRGMPRLDEMANESMRLSGINLPFENYAVMILEWSEADLMKLPPQERQTMQFILREAIEDSMGESTYAYSYLPSRLRIVLLINASEPDDAIITATATMARELLRQPGVRCMAATGGWTCSQSGISALYRAARINIEQRLFCPTNTLIIPCFEESVTPSALDDLESRFILHVRERRAYDAICCVTQMASIWQNQTPHVGLKALNRLSSALSDTLIRIRYNTNDELPSLVTDPKLAIWNIEEYPAAITTFLNKVLGNSETGSGQRNELLFAQTVHYIQQHLSESLSLERISNAMHFNPRYFSRLFKEMSGANLSDYINTCRMERASQLLRANSSQSIDEICQLVGYNSPQYFSRKFKEQYNMTPREYRLRMSHKE